MSTISVPLLDLKAQYATLRDEIEPIIRKVCEDQWFVMGPEVQAFEEEVASYLGVKHAIGCASGSDAVLLACMGHGVGCNGGHNDGVIVPSYTFFATAGSVYRLGATPIFADIDPGTYNMSVEHTRRLLETHENVRAIMPVHLFGQSADMDAFLALGEEFGVLVMEDAAQAIGTRDATGAMAGTRGHIGGFSFFPSKNLGAFGEGGLVTTGDDGVAETVRKLRLHGGKNKYEHEMVGLNSRLHSLQAAVLRVKLRHLEAWHAGRIANADEYDRLFHAAGAAAGDVPLADGGEALPLRTPLRPSDERSRHIFNQYVIRVPASIRDALRDHLRANDIGCEVYYPLCLHNQQCFRGLLARNGQGPGISLPHAERAARETLALPIFPELTAEQKAYVAETVIEFVKRHAGADRPVVETRPAAAVRG